MYYSDHGTWPSSNTEAGLPPSASFNGTVISGLDVSAGGVITETFSDRFGQKGGVLRFTPSAGATGFTDWSCTTPSFPDIAKWVPQCSYAGSDCVAETRECVRDTSRRLAAGGLAGNLPALR